MKSFPGQFAVVSNRKLKTAADIGIILLEGCAAGAFIVKGNYAMAGLAISLCILIYILCISEAYWRGRNDELDRHIKKEITSSALWSMANSISNSNQKSGRPDQEQEP